MNALAALLFTSAVALPTTLPINPAVTASNIHQTICVPGYSKSVRPSTAYTNKIKKGLMDAAGIDWSLRLDYELDHVLSIELGGHPYATRNLQLQKWDGPDGAHAKDAVENWLHKEVCLGKIPLPAAQDCLYNRWQQCRKEFGQ